MPSSDVTKDEMNSGDDLATAGDDHPVQSSPAESELLRGNSAGNDAGFLRWKVGLLGAMLIVVAACGIYLPTLDYDFIFDDLLAIVGNESIRELTPLLGEDGGYGPLNPKLNTPVSARPIISLSYAVNFHFSELDPSGYRIPHLILHVIAAFLLWLIIAATLKRPCFDGRFLRFRHELSIACVLLWLVHPVHTETVIYLTQRTELLMGFFYFLTVFCAIRYWASQRRSVRGFWVIAATFSSVMGMLSKEMMASVPAMVLMYEWTFVRGSAISILKRSWPLYVGLVISWIPIIAIYKWGYVTPLAGFNNTISAPDFWLTQSNSFFVYWKLLVWPWPLLLHYEVDTLTRFSEAWPGVVGMIAYAVVTTWLVLKRSPIGYALLFFFAVLSPTLIVPLPNEEICERRMYVPTAAVLPVIVLGAFCLMSRLRGSTAAKPMSLRWMLASQTPCVAMILAFFVVCVTSTPRLADRSKIWLEVLKYEPRNLFANAAQGAVEFNRGDRESGLARMHRSFDADPRYPYHVTLLTKAYEQLGQTDRLIETYRRAIAASPNDEKYLCSLASLLGEQGKSEEAVKLFEQSLAIDPEYHPAHSGLAVVLAEHRQLDLATEHFKRAVEIEPNTFNCNNLMGIYLRTQQKNKAADAARLLLAAAKREKNVELAKRIEQALKRLDP